MTRRARIGAAAEASIVVAGAAAVGLFATALVTFGWGVAKVWSFVRLLFDDGADNSVAIVRLLEVIEKLVKSDDPLGTLWYALAVSAVILALLAVRWVQKSDAH
jgi:hypothetical protein